MPPEMQWLEFGIAVIEFLVVCGILFFEILTWRIERENLGAFKLYLGERKRWYQQRNKKKCAEIALSTSSAEETSVEVGLTPSSGTAESATPGAIQSGQVETASTRANTPS